MDDKGRIQIPAQFRKLMPQGDNRILVMTQGLDNCIFIFTPQVWDRYMDKLRNIKLPSLKKHKLMRALLAPATNCKMDNQWRVKLPDHLQDYAGLKRGIKIVGMGDRLEVWDQNQYETETRDRETLAERYAPAVFDPGDDADLTPEPPGAVAHPEREED